MLKTTYKKYREKSYQIEIWSLLNGKTRIVISSIDLSDEHERILLDEIFGDSTEIEIMKTLLAKYLDDL